jgi:hypothetical protein
MAVTNNHLDPSPAQHALLASDAIPRADKSLPKRSLHIEAVDRLRRVAGDGS